MPVERISAANGFTLNRIHQQQQPQADFRNILSDLMQQTNEADAIDKAVNQELLVGDLQNLHAATIAAEKADIALRLTVQIRNKCVEAYNEIMRMQI